MQIEPATASDIGIRKSWPMRVNSTMRAIAVSGIFMDDARNAALPMIAKAPKAAPGQA